MTVQLVGRSRRQQQRRATIDDIKQVARELLVDEGVDSVTIRAIARRRGMTAPAVYRYFTSHEELLGSLRDDVFAEISRHVRNACADLAPDDTPRRLITTSRALRRWVLDHPNEFELLLAPTGICQSHDAEGPLGRDSGRVFGQLFADLTAELWRSHPFPVGPPGSLPPQLHEQLDRLRSPHHEDLPVEAVAVILRHWLRLYGLICMEGVGHLRFALGDSSLFFEHELADVCRSLGIGHLYAPPADRPATD
ncbi:TetR/AcrR family transcriptional regulator [Streptomyces sp. NPDC050504]|uniref:TetR/AcrR family transcriptional regulator n=1 Tax=Streptomyces sp. NPDC050504 TaxID=3365618 RepID=UPI0037A46964